MSKTEKVEPRWVLVEGQLHDVSDFVGLEKRQRPQATCPLCQLPVVLKLGAVNVHHYAHRTEASCAASQSETALHLNTKFHLYQQLKDGLGAQLFIDQLCQHCHEKKQRHAWLDHWDDAKVEYRMDTVRPDIALLSEGKVVGALEILVTHAVDDRKAAYFKEQAISWLEFSARPDIYEPPQAWTIADPLPLSNWEIPYPAWACEECTMRKVRERQEKEKAEKRRQMENERAERRERERQEFFRDNPTHAAMMFDVYFAGGKKYRQVFYVKKRLKDGRWIRSWVENRDKQILFSVDHPEDESLGNKALHRIKRFVAAHLNEFRAHGHIVDVVADWRLWKVGQMFVARAFDRYPLRFTWDEHARQWKASQKF